MANVYFNGSSVSVQNTYEEIVNFIIWANQNNYPFIELDEYCTIFNDSNTKLIKSTRKIYVQVSNILYVQ